jgi:hypothetical protein
VWAGERPDLPVRVAELVQLTTMNLADIMSAYKLPDQLMRLLFVA